MPNYTNHPHKNCNLPHVRKLHADYWKRFHDNFPNVFWSKVKKGTVEECWEWQSTISGGRYGCITHKGKCLSAHRTAYKLTFGDIAEGLFVCHKCDNTRCCNPAHLFLGTNSVNQLDSSRKGRMPSKQGINNPMFGRVGELSPYAKLTNENVKEIKKMFNLPVTNREIGELFSVTPETVSHIRTGRSWKHIKLDSKHD